MWLCTGFLEVQKVAGVTEEQVVGGRSRNSQPVGFGRPNPQFSIDRFVKRLSVAASDHSVGVLNVAD